MHLHSLILRQTANNVHFLAIHPSSPTGVDWYFVPVHAVILQGYERLVWGVLFLEKIDMKYLLLLSLVSEPLNSPA